MKKISTKWLQQGLTLIEVMFAAGILGVVILGASSFQQITIRTTQNTGDRVFAAQKAVQIFEELRAFVQANQEDALNSLQSYNDTTYSPILTSERIISPEDPLSKNIVLNRSNNTWKFLRKITVTDIPNDTNAKSVTVSIFYGSPDEENTVRGTKPLATTSGILKTNIGKSPPTQVYDMYVIALESVPAWWADISTIRPIFENTMVEMGNRNPGLEFRKHIISRMSYGRDPFYMPYVNTAGEVGAQSLPWIYFYPGKIQLDTNTNAREYYVEQNILGRKRTDNPDSTQAGASLYSPYKTNSQRVNSSSVYTPANGNVNLHRNYAIADSFNYAVRHQEEVAMQRRLLADIDKQIEATSDEQGKNILLERKRLASEPSLRMLLEDMNSNPDRYLNSMIVNLHAELVPVPPIRNFSDPAKKVGFSEDPDQAANRNYYAHKRVVTHPERLRYQGSEKDHIQLRVYPFEVIPPGVDTLPTTVDLSESQTQDTLDTITLFIPTDATGRNPHDPLESGFLNNPNISATNLTVSNVTSALSLARITGNPSGGSTPNAVPYAWRNDTATGFMRITDQDIVVPGGDNSRVQLLGEISDTGIGTTGSNAGIPYVEIPEAPLTIDGVNKAYTGTNEDSLCEQICNERFIIGGRNGEYAHRRIVRVRSVERITSGTDRWRVYLYPGSNTFNQLASGTNNDGYLMTRHRDYHISVNPDVYGQTRPGVLLTLFNTPTRHQANGSNGGLPTARRLYGMEYIPAPVGNPALTALGSPNATPNTYTFNSDRENLTNTSTDNAKNTARWRIRLNANATPFSTAFNNVAMAVETRIGPRIDQVRMAGAVPPSFTYTANVDATIIQNNLHQNLEEGINGDGDVYQPNSAGGNENLTRPRAFPHNVSRTYAYLDTAIPATEQHQFLGDPRLMPYADIKLAHGYNWFGYRNKCGSNATKFSNDCSNSDSGYTDYGRHQGSGWSNVDADLNRLYALYTDGVMNSRSIYNSISGYSSYYYGLGGEIGTDSSNTTFPVRLSPFRTTASTGTLASTTNNNDQINVFLNGNDKYIRSTSNSFGWVANAWLNELFPDAAGEFWLENGNLPTPDYASTHNATAITWPSALDTRFYRVSYDNGNSIWGANDYANIGDQALSRRTKAATGNGCMAFMNGNATGTGNDRFNHADNKGSEGELTYGENDAGRYLIDSFNLSMPGILGATRPFQIAPGSGTANGYGQSEIANKRNRIRHVNVKTGALSAVQSTENVYYRQRGSGNGDWTSSGLLKLDRSGNTDLSGYILVNGLSPSRTDGPAILARLAQGSMMQAYLAGGDFSGNKTTASSLGRIVQLPRVEINYPKPGASIKGDVTNLGVEAKLSWRRWDEQKYTDAYNNGWHEPVELRLQLKYSLDDGRTWYFVGDSTETKYDRLSNGVFYPAHEWGVQSPLLTSQAIRSGPGWNVSEWTQPQEKTPILIRLEAYRAGYENQGYSYHEVRVTMGDL